MEADAGGESGAPTIGRVAAMTRAEGTVVAVGGGLVAVRVGDADRVAKLAGRLSARPVVGDHIASLLPIFLYLLFIWLCMNALGRKGWIVKI